MFEADGRAEFEALQPRVHVPAAQAGQLAGQSPVIYMIFDLLKLEGGAHGLDYRSAGACWRVALNGPYWQPPSWFTGPDFVIPDGPGLAPLDGVVAKRLESDRPSGRAFGPTAG